jgi:hypothetical protein
MTQRVAFNRFAAGVSGSLLDLRAPHTSIRGRTGSVIDAFLDDGAVEIICAASQRHLLQTCGKASSISRETTRSPIL